MNKRDYYTVLEITRSCTLPEVRQSFKKLALRWHPDKCIDKIEAELRFNEIHEAYSILADERRKKIYDEYGHEGLKLDEERAEASNNGNGNQFFQKGFQGTDKSAFDILKDIVEENDDDYFFQNYSSFGISNNFQSTIKSFIEENVFCSKSEPETNFFETYQPTFMNPNFYMDLPEFPNLGFDSQCTTQVFSFLSSANNGNTAYASPPTMFQNGKVSSSTSDIFESLSALFINERTTPSTSKTSAESDDNKNYDSLFASKQKDGYLVFEDDSEDSPDANTTKDTEHFSFGEFDTEMSSESDTQQKLNSPSKKINKLKDSLNIRLTNKKSSKKNRS